MEDKLTFEQFKLDVFTSISHCPKNWRKGQSVFNIIDENYGVARDVQFKDHVDCFYNDSKIEEFLIKAYNRIINGSN